MTGALHLFSATALLSATLGAPHGAERGLTLALCGGGLVSIELPRREAPPPAGEACGKGCHSGCSRKRIDPAQ